MMSKIYIKIEEKLVQTSPDLDSFFAIISFVIHFHTSASHDSCFLTAHHLQTIFPLSSMMMMMMMHSIV